MKRRVKPASENDETSETAFIGKRRSLLFLLSVIKQGWVLFAVSLLLVIVANLAMGPGLAVALRVFTDAVTAKDSAGIAAAARGMILLALAIALGELAGSYALGAFPRKDACISEEGFWVEH